MKRGTPELVRLGQRADKMELFKYWGQRNKERIYLMRWVITYSNEDGGIELSSSHGSRQQNKMVLTGIWRRNKNEIS